MKDNMEIAMDELKRADHLIFVSLKYTRTVDVLKHVIERLINCIDHIFLALLEKQKEDGKIDSVPVAPVQRAVLIKSAFPDDSIIDELSDLFLRFRKIDKAPFEKANEFRRHVVMTVVIGDETIQINIDNITEYFKTVKRLFEHARALL